ncbi:YppE family protein [Salipaludibacillus daqingensis]|uniref:YppE family protein n=1 Tax=Salipaludibacillus daqingensis TaxID=3041001 RepID=UPI00247554A2|nr:YppE family protein [Salipaludibacillus daqingensis]
MNQEQLQELKLQTNHLRKLNEDALAHFKYYSTSENSAEFFDTVKPFADEVKGKLEDWTPQVLKWLEWKKPSYIHPQQIDQLVENFEILSVTCFQKDTRNKKLMERYKSIEYTLSLVDQDL